MTRASIIVVNWNGAEYLSGCLDAILVQTKSNDQVIVVDNASTDGSAEFVRERYPQIYLIENTCNLGFAGGLNVGLQAAQGDFLFSINPDVTVAPDWLESLKEAIDRPCVGIVGCKLFYPDGTIQHAGGIMHWPQAIVDHHGYRQPDNGSWDKMRQVDFVTGAAWGFRRAILEQVGFLDEGFWPGYYEEVDYCFRARQSGWQVVYVPKATGVHCESTSLEHGSKIYLEAFHRGRLRFVLKHHESRQAARDFVASEQQFVLKAPIVFAQQQILRRAYFDTLLSLPDLPNAICSPTDSKANTSASLPLELVEGLSDLYALALYISRRGDSHMEDLPQTTRLPVLHEHDFHSKVPFVGPLIQAIRRGLYSLTAKWSILTVIEQQNQINQTIEDLLIQQNREIAQRLEEIEELLIAQDRDIAQTARLVAETGIRQRYLLKNLSNREHPTSTE